MLASNVRWTEGADVVIVGYGGAGAVAAITSHDLGARVLVLEKQPADQHYTNTQMSGGAFINIADPDKAMRYMDALYRVEGDASWTDDATLRAWAEYCHHNVAWVQGHGGKVKQIVSGVEYRGIPGGEAIDCWQFAGAGLGTHRFLTANVRQRGIRVLHEAPARWLLNDVEGRVVGVRVALGPEQRPVDIQARRAVIMAPGGFEFDEAMKLQYLPVYPTHFYGTPANTGDGHRMVMDLGAEMWHMNCASARLVAKFPDFPLAFSLRFPAPRPPRQSDAAPEEAPGYVLVDRDGRRFTSENYKMHSLYYELTVFDSQRLRHPRVPCYLIFDRRRMEAGPVAMRFAGPSGPVQLYHWSLDNSAELQRGWIVEAQTIDSLAEKLGLPVENLLATVERYNGYCERGEDPEFHRRPGGMGRLGHPPYYAMRLFPGGPNTQGGPRRNHRAQVLHVSGRPIPRLYAAGEFGSVYAMLYPSGGGSIGECLAFGRIAAENAVREEPHDDS